MNLRQLQEWTDNFTADGRRWSEELARRTEEMQRENRRAAIRLGFLVLAQAAVWAVVWWTR